MAIAGGASNGTCGGSKVSGSQLAKCAQHRVHSRGRIAQGFRRHTLLAAASQTRPDSASMPWNQLLLLPFVLHLHFSDLGFGRTCMRRVAEMTAVLSRKSRFGPAPGADTSNTATHAWLAAITCCCSVEMLAPLSSVAAAPTPISTLCCT